MSYSSQHFHRIPGLKHEQKLCLETVAQKRDFFRYSTYWFPGESYFSIAALSTERLVKLSDLCEDLPVALSSSIAFPSLLRFAEGVSPVGDRTAVGRLELLVVH